MPIFRRELLGNGLQIFFTDESNRYFGDYYRVCVLATIVCDLSHLPDESNDEQSLRRRALETFGGQLKVVKRFERMGVPTADVERVRAALIDDFLQSAAAYLARPEYPRLFVTSALNKPQTHRYYG